MTYIHSPTKSICGAHVQVSRECDFFMKIHENEAEMAVSYDFVRFFHELS